MQIAAIPTGPSVYQPITAVPPVAPVVGKAGESGESGEKVRAASPPGLGSLLDIEA